jgi:hypothetical protein
LFAWLHQAKPLYPHQKWPPSPPNQVFAPLLALKPLANLQSRKKRDQQSHDESHNQAGHGNDGYAFLVKGFASDTGSGGQY